MKKMEVGCQCYTVVKQLVKHIGTDNGSNKLIVEVGLEIQMFVPCISCYWLH